MSAAEPKLPPDAQVEAEVREMGAAARAASRLLACAGPALKSRALAAAARRLDEARTALKSANALDLAAAAEQGLDAARLDRLVLDDGAIDRMVDGILQVEQLPDPVGEMTDMRRRPSGIQVGRMRVPLGVVGIIYESRPNVTADAASLCLKSGNACILRGGSEALASNRAIVASVREALAEAGLPVAAVQLVGTADRAAVGALLRSSEHIDVIVPRGGKGLIERVSRESRIPVIKHLDGVCHLYIDDAADVDMSQSIAYNSKAEKYAVCNALETLLVAEGIAGEVLPGLGERFVEAGVELRGCPKAQSWLPQAKAATDEDWRTEYLGPVLAVRVVDGIDQAIEHINLYGSQHTDAIVSKDYAKAHQFVRAVDSASVMVNASTQFADGMEYGLGAEIGISTDKLHARGPVGLAGLTTEKYVVFGNGEIRHR